MFKYLLCLRYLRTRAIALASVISVTLGVATMIVVNGVMEGFGREMRDRIHGILSDVIVEGHGLAGFPDADAHMARIRAAAGRYIEGMTPTIHMPAMLQMDVAGTTIPRQITLVGVDAATYSSVSAFGRYLQHPENRESLSFDLRDSGYEPRGGSEASGKPGLEIAGWTWRRMMAPVWKREAERQRRAAEATAPQGFGGDPFSTIETADAAEGRTLDELERFDPAEEQHPGLVLGIALSSYVDRDGDEQFLMLPGEDVRIGYPTSGAVPEIKQARFTVVDFYESKMSEYDSGFVFAPIETLQNLLQMRDPQTGAARVSAIQIRLKPGVDAAMVRDLLRQDASFPPHVYSISTWMDKQGPLLAAVQMETTILNILLFLIIAVAGFGILAIFYMIVVEKTRDIGVLKSLGASSTGVMSIFLNYGLSLGLVGAGAGLALGLTFVAYINQIADVIGWITGREVFDPNVYYFQEIPAIVEPGTATWIVVGAVAIAVAASVLPARRAAALHPVEALRYE